MSHGKQDLTQVHQLLLSAAWLQLCRMTISQVTALTAGGGATPPLLGTQAGNESFSLFRQDWT